MIPAFAQSAAARWYTAIDTRSISAARSGPTVATTSSMVMFSSCSPTSALAAGVKMGSGRRSACLRPGGNATPLVMPVLW